MIFWKNWPYPSKIVLAFFIFFLATLGFARLRAKSADSSINIEALAQTPIERGLWSKRPKVVYFWATWCSVCKTYSYILRENIKLLGAETLFLSVVEDVESQELEKYIKENHISYPVLQGNPQTFRDFGVNAFPTTLFLNAEGKIIFFDTGIINPVSFWIRSFLTRYL